MAHKPKIHQTFGPSKVTLGGISPQAITRRQIELKSCSNPLKTRESMQFASKKKTFQFRMFVFFNAYIMIGCLCYFLLMSAFLPDLPLRPAGVILNDIHFFQFSCFLVTFRDFERSEWDLAFLVPRLGPKNIKIREILQSIEKSPLPISCFLA